MKRFICLFLVLILFPFIALSDINYSPVGRWTIDSSYKEMVNNYMFAKTDFFFFEDGTVHRVSITKNKNDSDLTLAYDNGVWIGDRDGLTVRTGKDVFKCTIDDEGYLIVGKDDHSVKFMRVCSSEALN